jgi:hypothetical protein
VALHPRCHRVGQRKSGFSLRPGSCLAWPPLTAPLATERSACHRALAR